MIQQADRDLDVAKAVEDQADVPAEYRAKGYIASRRRTARGSDGELAGSFASSLVKG
jgi:hypothetical protein